MKYSEFLAAKQIRVEKPGRSVTESDVHPLLHPWQRNIVAWAVRTSRAALWEDTGLGKTFQQIEWARLSSEHNALIIAPLAVCQQTIREAKKLGITAKYVRSDNDISGGADMYVTNYERVQSLTPKLFDAVVLDEASVLKQSDGKTRTLLIEWARNIPHRLACSATPAPNDPEELTNQAEWLGRMSRTHMLAAYFIHDQKGWRLKGHGREPMYEWMANWVCALRRPSDIGGDDTGYILPGLEIIPEIVESTIEAEGQLFATDIGGVTGRAQMRRKTLTARVERATKLVSNDPGPWLLWCGLNTEADALAESIPGSVNVHGSLDPEEKARLLLGFADGDFDVLITKGQIAAQGMNFQHCSRMAFVGLSDSFEVYYQALRRCYRYGQKNVVRAHIILSDMESQIADNVKSKEHQSNEVIDALIMHGKTKIHG